MADIPYRQEPGRYQEAGRFSNLSAKLPARGDAGTIKYSSPLICVANPCVIQLSHGIVSIGRT